MNVKHGVNVLEDPGWRWGKGRGLAHGTGASPVSYRHNFLVLRRSLDSPRAICGFANSSSCTTTEILKLLAGRPKAALLFWFFGDRCGALLFMVIHVIYRY